MLCKLRTQGAHPPRQPLFPDWFPSLAADGTRSIKEISPSKIPQPVSSGGAVKVVPVPIGRHLINGILDKANQSFVHDPSQDEPKYCTQSCRRLMLPRSIEASHHRIQVFIQDY